MYKIIASDLDGTLLTPNHQLTIFTKKTLQLLVTNNIHLILATGRHHNNIKKIRNELKIHDYIITSNGARIHNPHGKLITAYNLDKKIIPDLLSIAHNNTNITTNIFRHNEWLTNRDYCESKKDNSTYKLDINHKIYQQKTLPLNGIFKIYFTSNNYQQLLLIEKNLKEKWNNYTNISFSLPNCLEVMPKNASKGNALKKVANLLGYNLKDCISFGDGMNDLEMLSMSGKGCIMHNAPLRLKKALPKIEIIGSNKNEAVAHYLNKIYLYQFL